MGLHQENPQMAVLIVASQERDRKIKLLAPFDFMQKPFSLVELDKRLGLMFSVVAKIAR
jgi:DNA-binding response OmpR family regulator